MAFRVINTARMDLTRLMKYGNGTTRLEEEEAAFAPLTATSGVTVNRSSARSNPQRINLRCPSMYHKWPGYFSRNRPNLIWNAGHRANIVEISYYTLTVITKAVKVAKSQVKISNMPIAKYNQECSGYYSHIENEST